MNDTIHDVPMPAEEDPLIHRYLGGLSRFAPASPHFQDRVLASVRAPEPAWVTQLRGRRRELAESGATWKVLGAIALGGVLPTAAVIMLAAAFHAQAAAGMSWLISTGLPLAWTRVVAEASHVFAPVESAVRAVAPTGTALAWRAAALAAVLAGCALGLARTMRAGRVVAS